MSRIAFLGLGAMGKRIVQRLVDAGHEVVVWNRSPEPLQAAKACGAQVASTPRQAAEGANFVLSMVSDDLASQTVWGARETGALLGLAEGSLAIEVSTVSPQWIETLAAKVRATGARFLEAPVVGSLPQAESGTLIGFAGGDKDDLTRAKPVLGAFAGTVHSVGPVGQGATMKLIANMLLATQVATIAELLGFAAKSGITPKAAMEMIASLPSASQTAIGMGRLMVDRDFAPRFTSALLAKDLRYALDNAKDRNADMPVTGLSRALFDRLCAAGDGDQNVTAIAKAYGL